MTSGWEREREGGRKHNWRIRVQWLQHRPTPNKNMEAILQENEVLRANNECDLSASHLSRGITTAAHKMQEDNSLRKREIQVRVVLSELIQLERLNLSVIAMSSSFLTWQTMAKGRIIIWYLCWHKQTTNASKRACEHSEHTMLQTDDALSQYSYTFTWFINLQGSNQVDKQYGERSKNGEQRWLVWNGQPSRDVTYKGLSCGTPSQCTWQESTWPLLYMHPKYKVDHLKRIFQLKWMKTTTAVVLIM